VSIDTQGHCCFAGQSWNSGRNACVGEPTSCPPGTAARGENCVEETVWPEAAEVVPLTAVEMPGYVRRFHAYGEPEMNRLLAEFFPSGSPAADNFTTAIANSTKPEIVLLRIFNKKVWGTHLKRTPTGFAVIPLERLRAAVRLNGIAPDVQDGWLRAVGERLAASGNAHSLILFSNGNGNSIDWSIEKESGSSIQTRNRFLEAGTFREGEYSPIVRNVESVSRTGFDQNGDDSVKRMPSVAIP
jgi:hypothetical protein